MASAAQAGPAGRTVTIYTTDSQELPTLIVEAVLLQSRVPLAGCPAPALVLPHFHDWSVAGPASDARCCEPRPRSESGNDNKRAWTRPIFVSQTAAATGFMPALAGSSSGGSSDEPLLRFCDTESAFVFVLRVVGARPERGLRLSLHESTLLYQPTTGGDACRHRFVEFMGVFYPGADAYLYASCPAPVLSIAGLAGTAPRLRLQLMDQFRRVLFARDWLLETGQLTEDAVCWLADTHHSLDMYLAPHLSGTSGAETAYADETDAKDSQPSDTEAAAAAAVSAAEDAGALAERRRNQRTDSLSGSFVNVSEADVAAERASLYSHSALSAHSASPIASPTTVPVGAAPIQQSAIVEAKRGTESGAVDIIQQLGFWFYGSTLGQMLTSAGSSGGPASGAPDDEASEAASGEARRDAVKTYWSPAPIWMLGREYRSDAAPGPRIFALAPIAALLPMPSLLATLGMTPRSLGAPSALQDADADTEYRLREAFVMPPIALELLCQHLSHWLSDLCHWRLLGVSSGTDRGEDDTKSVRSDQIVVEAEAADGSARLRLVAQAVRLAFQERLQCVLDVRTCSAGPQSTRSHAALGARTVFVDAVSELMALAAAAPATEGLGAAPSAAVQFVFKEAMNCAVDTAPPPAAFAAAAAGAAGATDAPLLRFPAEDPAAAAAAAAAAPSAGAAEDAVDTETTAIVQRLEAGMRVLLWSEHIGDWISRELCLQLKKHQPAPGAEDEPVATRATLIVSAPKSTGVGRLELDVGGWALFFADATLRFALAFNSGDARTSAAPPAGAVGAWLCMRAVEVDDFTLLLTAIPALRRLQRRTLRQALASAHALSVSSLSLSASSDTSGSGRSRSGSSVSIQRSSSPLADSAAGGANSLRASRTASALSTPRSETPSRAGTPPLAAGAPPLAAGAIAGMAQFVRAFETRFWFTYRRGFSRIPPTILTSDAGWGCMIRAGQSLLAETLAAVHFARRDWTLQAALSTLSGRQSYKQILSMFIERTGEEQAPFSVHAIARVGAALGTPIGEHFGPSTLARALRRLVDDTACARAAWEQRRRAGADLAAAPPDVQLAVTIWRQGVIRATSLRQSLQTRAVPHLVLLPLRLGAERINADAYGVLLRAALAAPQTMGIVGGRARRAYYIVGWQDASLLYLDPHTVRPVQCDLDRVVQAREYSCRTPCELWIPDLDPTVLLAFLVSSPAELDDLVALLVDLPLPMRIFSLE